MFPLQSRSAWPWLESMLEADRWLLLKVNRDWHHPMLDSAALVLREAVAHAPLYLFLVLLMWLNHGHAGLRWVMIAVLLAGVSDFLSSHVIKDLFDRPRPCREQETAHSIRFIARYCGMNGSFISSHASNHFALATYVWLSLRRTGRYWALMFPWAASVAYAQVYVGVHYPSDVICGALFGAALAWMACRLTRIGTDNSNTAS